MGTPKTNAMRILEKEKISYQMHTYDASDGQIDGAAVARKVGMDPAKVFKTLVTEAKSGQHYVFMIPVEEELDLKKAAQSVGEKAVSMLKAKELFSLTGYIHGGCSPVGMKKPFRTVLHRSAQDFDEILFSAGKIGYQVEMRPEDLKKVVPFLYADVIVDA